MIKKKVNEYLIIFAGFHVNYGYVNVAPVTYPGNAALPTKKQNQSSNDGSNDNLRCVRCGKIYSSKTNLRRHERFECDGFRRFFCHICGSKYTQNGSLRVHLAKSHNVVVPTRRKIS